MYKLQVVTVKNGGQGEKLGVIVGDFIISYNGHLVKTQKELEFAIEDAKLNDNSSVDLAIQRNNGVLIYKVSNDALGLTLNELDESDENDTKINHVKLVGNKNEFVLVDVNLPFETVFFLVLKVVVALIALSAATSIAFWFLFVVVFNVF